MAKLVDYVAGVAGKERLRICSVPTAMGASSEALLRFYEGAWRQRGELSHVRFFPWPPPEVREHILSQDVVVVAGGNTANMLAIWRVHGVDHALREAWERGAVLGGMSAGANCWFEACVTDSFGPELRELGDGLGILSGSFCPHYDGEPERRPTYTRLVRDGVLPPGYAADDDAAFHFEGTELREVVSQRDGASGYRVTVDGETPIEPRRL